MMNTTTVSSPSQMYLAKTHAAVNVSRELVNYNLYAQDAALVDAVRREGAAWAHANLSSFGAFVARAEYLELGALANKFGPELDTHDRFARIANQRDLGG
jgi:putative acyl-CoA dehydrogenase